MIGRLRLLAKKLVGGSSSSASVADSSAAAAGDASARRSLRIVKVVRQTADAVVLYLEDVSAQPVTFEAGQFLTLKVDVGNECVQRSYSICSAPDSGELAVAVKRVALGRASNYLNDHASAGQLLEARGPSGRFVLPASTAPRLVVLVAGGSGITPLFSHAQHLLAREPESRVLLLYGNRGMADIIFRSELEELALRHAPRFTVRHVLSEPAVGFASGQGVLDATTVRSELATLLGSTCAQATFLVCGPEPMMQGTHAALLQLGVAERDIREERFTAASGSNTTQGGAQPLTITAGSQTGRVVTQPGETILEAAQRAQIDLDFSCTTGACGTCMARLCEGTVEMDPGHTLSAKELASGMILPCVARATSPCRVEALR